MNLDYEFLALKEIDSVLSNLKKFGIAVIPNYLGSDVLVNLNKEFDLSLSKAHFLESIISQSKHPLNPDGKTARLALWHRQALSDFPTICQIFRNDFMREIAEAYYGPNDVELNDQVFITYEKPSESPILPWHFDRIQSLKFWFNLTDTDSTNGAFEYCPGTHWEGHYRASFHLSQGLAVEDIPNDIDESMIMRPVTLSLNAGDLLIFDSDGFHRGGVVQPEKERRVIRGHTHPVGIRRYGDRPLSAGWWQKSFLNINKWTGNASKRVIGELIQDRSVNRKKNKL